MEHAGCALIADMTQLAVMWFFRVLAKIHCFVDLARRAERSFLDERPDICVLVDFPGFHWWLAWRAKRHGIPVVFYCPPQIWAWASWRIHKMRRLIDHVLSALPFEHEWFLAQGISSTYVGHPFFDVRHAPEKDKRQAEEKPLVLLLPGSRGQEIEANLKSLLLAAQKIEQKIPHIDLVVAALHERHAKYINELIQGSPAGSYPKQFVVEAGKTSELIPQATVAVCVSGSVSLELLAARVPSVMVFSLSGLAYVVQSWMRHCRSFTLVNLLAMSDPIGPVNPVFWPPRQPSSPDPKMLYPEYLTVADPSSALADHVVEWLTDPKVYKETVTALEKLAGKVAQPGSASRAAEVILNIATDGLSPSNDDKIIAVQHAEQAA
jgi:lipid-A-disaccharide synthase